MNLQNENYGDSDMSDDNLEDFTNLASKYLKKYQPEVADQKIETLKTYKHQALAEGKEFEESNSIERNTNNRTRIASSNNSQEPAFTRTVSSLTQLNSHKMESRINDKTLKKHNKMMKEREKEKEKEMKMQKEREINTNFTAYPSAHAPIIPKKKKKKERILSLGSAFPTFSSKSDHKNKNKTRGLQSVAPQPINKNSNNNSNSKNSKFQEAVTAENSLCYHNLDRTEYSAKYIILDKERALDKNAYKKVVEQIFKNTWRLKKPKLLISVTGSAQNFQMKPNLRTVFRRGIAQAAKATQAWILTGGTYSGVMKHVGDAMHEYSAWQDDQQMGGSSPMGMGMSGMSKDSKDDFLDIPVIGFATYETLSKAIKVGIDDAKNINQHEDYDIEVPADGPPGSGAYLDRNHTHFILVSSEENRKIQEEANKNNNEKPGFKWGQEIELWAKIEEYIIKSWDKDSVHKRRKANQFHRGSYDRINSDGHSKPIPALLISIQGGPGTLDTAYNHLKQNVPLVAIRSSGGWSDIICDMCGKTDFTEYKQNLKERAVIQNKKKDEVETNSRIQNFTLSKGFKNDTTQYITYVYDRETLDLSTDVSEVKLIFSSKPDPENSKFSKIFTGQEAILAAFIVEKLIMYKMCVNKQGKRELIDVNHITTALKIYEFKQLVTVFELTQKDNELDTAMMKAVLSAQQYKEPGETSPGRTDNTKISKIHLAIDYDKAELIREELYQDDAAPLNSTQLGEIFDQAISFRKPKFIDLLLDMDFDYKQHVTRDKLMEYYEPLYTNNQNTILFNVFKSSISSISNIKLKPDDFDSFKTCLHEMEKFIFGPEFTKSFDQSANILINNAHTAPIGLEHDNDKRFLEVPLRHLLFWSAMLGDFRIVEVLYKHLARYEGGGIIAALSLTTIFKKGSHTVHAIEQKILLKNQSKKYEEIAVNILNKAYQKASIKSALIVGLPSPAWGGMTPLKMAIQSHAREFVSQQGFQEWLNIIWYDRIEPITTVFEWIKILVLTLTGWIPGVLNLFLTFRDLPWVVVHTEKRMYFERYGIDPDHPAHRGTSNDGSKLNTISRPVSAAALRPGSAVTRGTGSSGENSQINGMDDGDNDSITQKISHILERTSFTKTVEKLNYLDKFKIFYGAPCVKFVFNAMAMLLLIFVYAYFLILEFCYIPNSLEIIVMVWMSTIFIDEIRQFRRSGTTFSTRVHYYFSDKWNLFDVFVFIIYLVGIIMRTIAVFADDAFPDWKAGRAPGLEGINIYEACTSAGVTVGLDKEYKGRWVDFVFRFQ